MSKVNAGITISLDGLVTGPNDRLGAGLGDGGEQLHYWVFGGPWRYGEDPSGRAEGVDKRFIEEVFDSAGAMIVGRTMHDVVDGWGDEPGFGMPAFVVTHRPRETQVKGDTTFTFVEGIEPALEQARAAAGEQDVLVMGGADVIRQFLRAGLIDEFTLTIAPVLLGDGKRLFEGRERTDLTWERFEVLESPFATHLRFRVA